MAAKKKTSANSFTVELELGNEAMQTQDDIISALKNVIRQLPSVAMSKGIAVKIKDANGNTVGKWGYE